MTVDCSLWTLSVCLQVVGVPTEESWPGVNELPNFRPGQNLFIPFILLRPHDYYNNPIYPMCC